MTFPANPRAADRASMRGEVKRVMTSILAFLNPRQRALNTARKDREAASLRYWKAAKSKAKRDMGEAAKDLETATRRVLWLEGVR